MANRVQQKSLFRTESHPAPGELVRVHGFLNTWSDELNIEDFASPASTQAWLREAGLWQGSGVMTRAEHARVVDFRQALRAYVLDPDQLAAVAKLVGDIQFNVVLTEQISSQLVAKGNHCDKALGAIMAIVYKSMADGSWSRFKCCALPSCGWAYYDTTRSRTKRWCSMQTCGSRHKAREYYKRQK